MSYKEIIKQIAIKENISEKEVEMEMEAAIRLAGFDCSVEDFIKMSSKLIKKRTIYSNIV